MIETPIAATRRQMLALGMLAAAGAVGAQAQPKITMLINQSPWFDGFKKVVERYEKDTGNRIELDVTPFGGMLEKTRNSLRASAGTYDLLALNAMWMNEVYGGGFLQALDDIEPGYRLPANVLDFDQSVYWNDAKKSFDPSGRLLGVPVNGNVQVLYFRRDLYKEKGLKEPTTWAELEANAKALHNPAAGLYGFGIRGDRGSATYDVSPFIYSHGGRIFKDERNGDYTVALSSAASLKGLETYLRLARDYGPPSAWAMSQDKLIQLMATGKVAHAVAVIAVWGALDDPKKSAVVGKFDAALMPRGEPGRHASAAGHWVAGIARNVSAERKRAAMAFLKWFVRQDVQVAYVQAGAVPVISGLGEAQFGKDDRYRFLEALSENSKNSVFYAPVKERVEINDLIGLKVNQALLGELTPKEALNQAAEGIHDIARKAGYKTGRGEIL